MTNREWYQATFQQCKPSEQALQKVMGNTEPFQILRKRQKIRWTAAGIALLLGAAGCGYALQVSHIETSKVVQYDSYDQYQAASVQENPFQIALPRKLGFGFIYLYSDIKDQSKVSTQGEALENRKMLTVIYGVSGSPAYLDYWGQSDIYVSITSLFEEQQKLYEKEIPASTRNVGDVEINYISKKVLCVGTDYELTAEEEKKVRQGDYFVQRSQMWKGSQEKTYTSCCWMKDGLFYEVLEYDTRLTEDDWYTIAETFLNAE